mgnify:CR=1 FL=1
MAKVRVDQLLVDRGLAPTRAKAQALVLAGLVHGKDSRIEKPGHPIAEDSELYVKGSDHGFVSRGGVKLAGALDAFAVDPTGLVCLDVGSSTGGFTDCLLQRGATKVFAVDVCDAQLHAKLLTDRRVIAHEGTNAREITAEFLGGPVDLVVVDASFIGLGKPMEAIARCTKPGGALVALVKPQFEAGRDAVTKGRGVIRDEAVRTAAIERAVASVKEAGYTIVATTDCVLPGPKGNVEAFVHATRLL